MCCRSRLPGIRRQTFSASDFPVRLCLPDGADHVLSWGPSFAGEGASGELEHELPVRHLVLVVGALYGVSQFTGGQLRIAFRPALRGPGHGPHRSSQASPARCLVAGNAE